MKKYLLLLTCLLTLIACNKQKNKANIAESKYAHSRADFVAKLEIALKEASETGKWLEMLLKTEYISLGQYKELEKDCATLRILLIASIKTAKENGNLLR